MHTKNSLLRFLLDVRNLDKLCCDIGYKSTNNSQSGLLIVFPEI